MTVTIITRPGRTQIKPTLDLSGEATPPLELARQTWGARKLLLILARKDFHVRYRRASFGILWALALPILQALVLAFVFTHVAHIQNPPHFNYTMYVLSGMAPWSYFVLALPAGSTAVVDGSAIASKVYFPRTVLPLAQLITALYGYVITIALVLVLCPLFHVHLGAAALLVLPATLFLIAITGGFVLVISALHVYFRDLRYFVSAAMMVWMYVTPIVYRPTNLPRLLLKVVNINPMTGVVDLFHAATVGQAGPLAMPLAITSAWTACLLILGGVLHCRFNRVFGDLL